jgi:uncharacterized protein (TIGR02001 family)
LLFRLATALGFAGLASPAAAQVAAEIGLQSDYRHRGFSLTDGNPVGTASVTYDDPSGVYAGGSVVGTLHDGEPELVSLQGNLGYAARLSPEVSIDGGIARTEFGSYVFGSDVHYTEFYLGLATRNVTARVRYSPDYYRSNWETLYVEIDGGAEVAPDWVVSVHAGQLTYLGHVSPYLARTSYDWRLGGSRQLGPWGLHLEVLGRVARRPPALVVTGDDNPLHATDTAILFGVTRAF